MLLVAKNYLTEDELKKLNKLVSMYLDYAEQIIERKKIMRMKDWIDHLNKFLTFNEYDILEGYGRIKKEIADSFAKEEYEKYRIIQDKEYKSDFDEFVNKVKTKSVLPSKKES